MHQAFKLHCFTGTELNFFSRLCLFALVPFASTLSWLSGPTLYSPSLLCQSPLCRSSLPLFFVALSRRSSPPLFAAYLLCLISPLLVLPSSLGQSSPSGPSASGHRLSLSPAGSPSLLRLSALRLFYSSLLPDILVLFRLLASTRRFPSPSLVTGSLLRRSSSSVLTTWFSLPAPRLALLLIDLPALSFDECIGISSSALSFVFLHHVSRPYLMFLTLAYLCSPSLCTTSLLLDSLRCLTIFFSSLADLFDCLIGPF